MLSVDADDGNALTAADPTSSCRLASIAMTPTSFNIRGSSSLIKWFPANNTVGLALQGIANPTLITLYPNTYGMISASLWVNTKVGINTAFYVSNAFHAVYASCASLASHASGCCHASPLV
jgi:hypothetical protein